MRNNKKGFTLVELLAVIVVLAIIMIIAVPSVMDSMNNARKGSFVVYAQKTMTTAETKVQALSLSGGLPNQCYTLKALMGENTGTYNGYVVVGNIGTATNPTFNIYLKDNNYSIENKTAADLKQESVGDSKTLTIPVGCCKTMACSDANDKIKQDEQSI